MRLILMFAAVICVLGCAAAAQAGDGDAADRPVSDESAAPEISRDGWRARVEDARRRLREAAIERRLNPAPYQPPPQEDLEQVATERVLNDQSLQFGDIVSTRNGLFVFRGRSDRERRPEDFVALPAR